MLSPGQRTRIEKLAPRADVPRAIGANGLDCQTGLKALLDPKRLSGAVANLHTAIDAADKPEQLDMLAGLLWRGYGEGEIGDHDAEALQACIDRRRPLGRATAPGWGKPIGRLAGRIGSRFASRQRPRSPDRRASRDRRRTLGGSSALPDTLRRFYTEGQRAVLCIVAGEVKRQGVCDMPIDKIAALAGVCRTTVQTTMHEARRLGHIRITERPQPGRKSLPNLVEVSSPEWRAWLQRGPSTTGRIGSNSLKMVSTTKREDQKATSERERWRGHGPPDWGRTRRSA